jgi:outer membrane protein OmpA-like peptidoglycan-associated protein
MFASNRNGGTGDDDIYFIKFRDIEKTIVDTLNVDKYISDWEVKSVYFEFDKFNLEQALSDENIRDLKLILSRKSNCNIHLIGYTDSEGTAEYNKSLGLKRAQTVKKALGERGINVEQIVITSMGEENQPNDCKPNCSDEDDQLNRVVQIKLECD